MSHANQYDAIVVGAGIGGSNVAAQLSEAGLKCLVIEAGHYFSRRTYPRCELDGNTQLFWHGGLELNSDATLALLRPKVVGGGSIVNQALLDEFDDDALDSWRAASGFPAFSLAAMQPWYAAAKSALSVQTVPVAFANRNADIFKAGFEQCGFHYAPLTRAQSGCHHEAGNDCIECLYGCRLDSKQSTPLTSLKRALKAGCQLIHSCEVMHIEESTQGVTLACRHANGSVIHFHGQRLILAANAIGTTTLLLRAGFGERLPMLGRHFYSHPQYMYFARYREPVNAQRGPLQSYKSADPHFRKQGFKLENVFAPPIGTALLLPQHGVAHQAMMQNITHLASIEVAIRDTEPGQIRLQRNGRARIDKTLNHEDKQRAAAGKAAVYQIFERTGAEQIMDGRLGIGLHLMGGVRLAEQASAGCVGHDFRLFGSQRIHVADSSLFPNAPGINPSLTIMALGRMAAQAILEAA
ncbi:choline dehydrogenase-like flavoprotein [Chitinivorax tropicus]|uniref:Choline dehydrogenase-like flavoprotein n=1 Tax=Chitinivorax tropicus TaxID=714531 RepID=A0A840MN15_9PROT|nr:GMC family oxidoreductase [Chitinivorax tropicus]MBB5019810.1 choline dehydrogenase-like flavoprotein [Chitinivorax tropicus]